jgi:hypothetical protein
MSRFGRDVGGEKRREAGALDGQGIQVWARVTVIAITRKVVGPQGIGNDQQDPQIFTPGAWCAVRLFSERLGSFWLRRLWPSHQKTSTMT